MNCIDVVLRCVFYLCKVSLVLNWYMEDIDCVGGISVILKEMSWKEGVFYFD